MPWSTLSVVDQREEFIRLASAVGANVSELCDRFGISRKTGYKWLERYAQGGRAGLADRSRHPRTSPKRTSRYMESAILAVRAESNNGWGGRKIEHVLEEKGWRGVPRPSTITEILRRNGKLIGKAAEHPGPYQRFEHEQPNALWQMDFKGHFATATKRCHPLAVLDDHSRYALGLEACANEREGTVRACLTSIFRRYGMPERMLMDNGSPWGDDGNNPFTLFTAWLMQLGVAVSHGRPYHPQTQGKTERFNRTIDIEVLANRSFADLPAVQYRFDAWRHKYNHERPHEALAMAAPASRYRMSLRSFPEKLPGIVYDANDIVRRVDENGKIAFKGCQWRISKAFRGKPVALRPMLEDGVMSVYFCSYKIRTLDLRNNQCSPA
jgi:transposase InsO family protein